VTVRFFLSVLVLRAGNPVAMRIDRNEVIGKLACGIPEPRKSKEVWHSVRKGLPDPSVAKKASALSNVCRSRPFRAGFHSVIPFLTSNLPL